MNLKSLELFGFKSFMRKLDIHFSDGITVIVGPNGCGKTNVTDALRWVLGEGSAKNLRGARMEDLIFNGTRDYKPLNVAEVGLTIDNSAGVLPTEYTEVTITRRVFRNGESEFLINRIPCRLRDIQDLLMDTGLGSRAYSVIERDMVEMVLADQPEKRRELLEEAAGIMKYKIRERQAQRKLAATDEDMNRIHDVLAEVDRQVRSLKRQVGAARRYQETRERQRWLEGSLARVDLDNARRESSALREELAEVTTEREGGRSRVSALETEIEELRLKSAEADSALAGIQREVDAIADEVRRFENENVVRRERRESLLKNSRRLASERDELQERIRDEAVLLEEHATTKEEARARLADVAGRLEAAEEALRHVEANRTERETARAEAREAVERQEGELARRRTDLANLTAHRDHLADRRAVVEEELREISARVDVRRGETTQANERANSLRSRLSSQAEELERISTRQSEIESERERMREEESRLSVEAESIRSGVRMLRGLREGFEGYGRGARRLLTGEAGPGVLRPLGDEIRVLRPDLVPALDTALAAAVEYVVAPSSRDALDAVRSLQREGGRATLVDLESFRSFRRNGHPDPRDAAILGGAGTFLSAGPDVAPVLDALLARYFVVESLEDAVRLAGRTEHDGIRFIARDGSWAEYPGLVHGGREDGQNDSRILGRSDRIAELERDIERALGEREGVRREIERLEGERETLAASLAELESRRDGLVQTITGEEKAAERVVAEILAAESRLGAVRAEMEEISLRETRLEERRAELTTEIEVGEEEGARRKADLERWETNLTAQSDDRDRARTACHELHLERQAARADDERIDREIALLAESRRANEEGIARRGEELQSTDRTVGELARELEAGLAEFTGRSEELESRRKVRDRVASDRAEVLEKLRAVETERDRWARLRDSASERAHEIEMKASRLSSAEEELTSRLAREFEIRLDGPGAERWADLVEAPPQQIEETRTELDGIRTQMQRMGPVNLVALEQYERESRRLEFLETQKQDLEEARESLRRTIRKINRTARTLFMETLEQVRTNFERTFGLLFHDGQADIRLVGDEDPLNAPIEIFARPRGKRLGNISLMSSGERSLTAIAFLFAIYLVKPSPFCILDEVDAPLDDANIGRFLSLLRTISENTQFVMITHNKKTMEVADYMYGVTMEEAGISKLVSVRLGDQAGDVGAESFAAAESDLVMEGSA